MFHAHVAGPCVIHVGGLKRRLGIVQGAAFTFNAQSFTDFVLSLKMTEPLSASSKIPFPTFSHALKDPTPSLEPLEGHHRIVIIEGLYTFLDVEPWRRAAEVLDLRVFIDVDPRTARERLVRRCLAEGIEDTLEKAVERGECFYIAFRGPADFSFECSVLKLQRRSYVFLVRRGGGGWV